METEYYHSPVGWLEIMAEKEALVGLRICDKEEIHKPVGNNPVIRQAISQLDEYFEGKRKQFELPLSFKGTEFQKKVWNVLLHIPCGKTLTYAEIARSIDHPKAYRAVGSANGKNPLPIIIPCHRVIASDGSLGGYAYGLNIKKKLLDIETLKINEL
jgi:methylated-DNA-[protein]-cysteine S-methyltransferase